MVVTTRALIRRSHRAPLHKITPEEGTGSIIRVFTIIAAVGHLPTGPRTCDRQAITPPLDMGDALEDPRLHSADRESKPYSARSPTCASTEMLAGVCFAYRRCLLHRRWQHGRSSPGSGSPIVDVQVSTAAQPPRIHRRFTVPPRTPSKSLLPCERVTSRRPIVHVAPQIGISWTALSLV